MAGNYPRIPDITPGLGLVHDLLLLATHRSSLRASLRRSAPPPRGSVTKRRTTCPSSDGATRDVDGFCSEDRRGCRSPWTAPMEGPTTREHSPPRDNSAARSILTVPHSLLSLIRCTFRRRGVDALFINVPQTNAGFPPCSRPRVRHSGEERFKRNDKHRARQSSHQLRELFLLVSQRSEISKVHS